MGMAGYQHYIFLGRAPVIHIHIMQCFQLVVGRRTIGINFQKALQRPPDITYKPFTESISIALLIALVAMRAKNIEVNTGRNRHPHDTMPAKIRIADPYIFLSHAAASGSLSQKRS